MSVKKIEIVPWVKFNAQEVKDELEALAKSCISKMYFLSKINDKNELSLSDEKVVADKFFKKEE